LSGAAEDGQATVGSDRNAYGCCGQALTRFTADPPAGPGRLLGLQIRDGSEVVGAVP